MATEIPASFLYCKNNKQGCEFIFKKEGKCKENHEKICLEFIKKHNKLVNEINEIAETQIPKRQKIEEILLPAIPQIKLSNNLNYNRDPELERLFSQYMKSSEICFYPEERLFNRCCEEIQIQTQNLLQIEQINQQKIAALDKSIKKLHHQCTFLDNSNGVKDLI